MKLNVLRKKLNDIVDNSDRDSTGFNGINDSNRTAEFIFRVIYNEFDVPELSSFDIKESFVEYLSSFMEDGIEPIIEVKTYIEKHMEKGQLYDFITLFLSKLPLVDEVSKKIIGVPFFATDQNLLIKKIRSTLYNRSSK